MSPVIYDDEAREARVSNDTINDVEKRITELVATINTDMTPNATTSAIAEHTKAIISRATLESRTALHELFDAFKKLDDSLKDNDARLRLEIDKHVGFTITAREATETVIAQLRVWQKEEKPD
jgi:hypothetical protein